MSFWQGKRVMVTGGAGFLGRHIVDLLADRDAVVFVPRSRDYNLVSFEQAQRAMEDFQPQVVIHTAAFYGGIWINQLYPGRIFYENLVMGANLMEAARLAEVEVWGSGQPVREFLYVEDCAEAIVRAAEVYNDLTPLNICCGEGTSIRKLAELVKGTAGFRGEIVWNTEKPDGQMMKVLDATRMERALNWYPPTSLADGLRKTVDWYVAEKATADLRV